MGELEPDDSRDVTLNQGSEPGGLERTGPKEDAARERAQKEKPDPKTGNLREPGHEGTPNSEATRLDEQQQRAQQSQSGGGQSQTQGDATQDQGSMARELTNPESAIPGNQPQAAEGAPGSARPQHDQYELNQPGAGGTDLPPEQAAADAAGAASGSLAADDGEGGDTPQASSKPAPKPADSPPAPEQQSQPGYGNARDEQGHMEQDERRAEQASDQRGEN